MAPYLTDDEISDICRPLKLPAAQRRHLARLGMLVKTRPDGRPLVARSEFERVMSGAPPAAGRDQDETNEAETTGPNVIGLENWARGRKRRGKSS